ncbi:MAG TPA: ribonuclease P protein component [Acidobacteriota bacterium]|nr:ribonuclease P protein component [Acidobacteriota bacterium]
MPEKRDESFSSRNRLRRSSDFQVVFSRGKRAATEDFVLLILPNHLPLSRLGIQVRAKIGSAVKRNKIKRIVREVFRKMKDNFSQSVDVIFIARAGMVGIDFHRFEEELKRSLRKWMR